MELKAMFGLLWQAAVSNRVATELVFSCAYVCASTHETACVILDLIWLCVCAFAQVLVYAYVIFVDVYYVKLSADWPNNPVYGVTFSGFPLQVCVQSNLLIILNAEMYLKFRFSLLSRTPSDVI